MLFMSDLSMSVSRHFVRLFSLCILLFLNSYASAQTNLAGELESMKGIYEENLVKIDNESSGKITSWPVNYLKELDALQKSMQKAGNLDGWQVVNKEIKRFNGDQHIVDSAIVKTPSELSNIQKKYQTLSSSLELEGSKKIIALTEMYLGRLTAMQKKLTIAGKIDDAVTVSDEIKRTKSNSKVTTAEFVVMASEPQKSDKKAEPVSEPRPVETVKKTGKTDISSRGTTGDDEASSGEAKVYDGTPPLIPGMSFKPIALSGSENMRISKKISLNATIGKKSETSTSASGSSYYNEHSRTGTKQTILRINVKPSNSAMVLESLKMAVQIYVKDVSGRDGKPKLSRIDVIKIAKISGAKPVCVECLPLEMSSSSYRYSGYSYSSSSSYGQDYYGVIISIFDTTGELLYQGASTDTLEKMGVTEEPKEEFNNSNRSNSNRSDDNRSPSWPPPRDTPRRSSSSER